MALRVAVTLGLPDRLRGDGAAADRLATELNVSPVALEPLLGHLATLGIVEPASIGYRTTGYGLTLCADADNGLTNLLHLEMAGGRAELALVELLHSITTGHAGYPRRYGQDFWADLAEYPHLRESFDQQMTQRLREQLPQIVAGYDWARFATIVDVGGGNGTLLAAILAAHPRIRGHLVDLDPTAAQASRTFSARHLDHRAQASAGSIFDPLPEGADAYLLCDILPDRDDRPDRPALPSGVPPRRRPLTPDPQRRLATCCWTTEARPTPRRSCGGLQSQPMLGSTPRWGLGCLLRCGSSTRVRRAV